MQTLRGTWVIVLDNGEPVIWWRGMKFTAMEMVAACNFDLPYEGWRAFRACLDVWRRAGLPVGSKSGGGCEVGHDPHPPPV